MKMDFIVWGVVACLFGASQNYGLLINRSQSLPHKLYVWEKASPQSLKKGQLVILKDPTHDRFLTKKIVGIEGDTVCLKDGRCLVAGKVVGPLQAKDSKGKELRPTQSQKIPTKTVFVAGTHPKSLDSRYTKIGLIPHDKILGQAWAVF